MYLMPILFIIWIIFWSFASVIISRLKLKESWILTWRSRCSNCKHIISTISLVPVISYILQKWRSKCCNKKIPIFYPFLEIVFWLVFSSMWYMFITYYSNFSLELFSYGFIISLVISLILAFLFLLLFIYDLLYLELPDEISFILLIFVSIIILYFNDFILIYSEYSILEHVFTWIFLYTIFYLKIFIPWFIQAIKTKTYWLIIYLLIYYFLLLPEALYLLIFKKEFNIKLLNKYKDIEINAWIWWWDLRLVLILWLLFWPIISLIWIFLSYILWSIIWIFIKVVYKKNIISFWPILILWFILSLIFKEYILLYLWLFY